MDKERVIEIMEEILSYVELNPKQFAESLGFDRPQAIYDIMNPQKKVGISKNMAEKICSKYTRINKMYLLTGEGQLLNVGKPDSIEPKIIDNEEDLKDALEKGIKLLPEVDFKFAAGQIDLINGTENIKRYWFLPDCRDCEAVAQIAGDSMSPAYPSGCWVALKKYGYSMEDATQIPFGNVFGIVVQDKYTGDYHGYIKVLRRYRDESLCRKYWIAHSLNEKEYDDFDIEIAQVRSLWVVKQHIVSDILL